MTTPVSLPPRRQPANDNFGVAPSLDRVARGGTSIQEGMGGQSVTQAQQLLANHGIQLDVDGKFGPQTDAAVRQFQQAHNLEVDGKIGPQTLAALQGGAAPVTHSAPPPVTDGVDRTQRPGPTPRAPTTEQKNNPPPNAVRAGDLANANRPNTPAPVQNNRPATTGNVPVTMAPAGSTEQQKFDHYAAIIRANGGQVCPNGQPTVLGMRGMSVDGQKHDSNSTRRYDEAFVVLTPDGRVRELPGSTHPGQTRSSMSPDVSGDGVGDVGTIRTGNYRVVPNGPHAGNASFHVLTLNGSGNLPGTRDTNHDGVFSADEQRRSAQRGDTLDGVLFHQGNASSPSSIGCQTMSPGVYNRFLQAVGGPRASFTYTMVDASH